MNTDHIRECWSFSEGHNRESMGCQAPFCPETQIHELCDEVDRLRAILGPWK